MTWSMFDVCQPCCVNPAPPDPCPLPADKVLIYSRTELHPQDYSELAALYDDCDWYGPDTPLSDDFSIDDYKLIYIMAPSGVEPQVLNKLFLWLLKGSRRLVLAGDGGEDWAAANDYLNETFFFTMQSRFSTFGSVLGSGCVDYPSTVYQIHPLARWMGEWQNYDTGSISLQLPFPDPLGVGLSTYRFPLAKRGGSWTLMVESLGPYCGYSSETFRCSELILSADTQCFGGSCPLPETNKPLLKRLLEDDVTCSPCWRQAIRVPFESGTEGPYPFTCLFEYGGELYLMQPAIQFGFTGWTSRPIPMNIEPYPSLDCVSSLREVMPTIRIDAWRTGGALNLSLWPPCGVGDITRAGFMGNESVRIENYDCSSPPESVVIGTGSFGSGTLYFLGPDCLGEDRGVVVDGCEQEWPSVVELRYAQPLGTGPSYWYRLLSPLGYFGEDGWEGLYRESWGTPFQYYRLWQENDKWKLSIGLEPLGTGLYLGEASSVSCCTHIEYFDPFNSGPIDFFPDSFDGRVSLRFEIPESSGTKYYWVISPNPPGSFAVL